MPRQELHTDSMPIEQKSPISDDPTEYDGDIVLVDPELAKKASKDYLAELAFNEEPVTIRLQPTTDKNASKWLSVWVNGKGAEILVNGQWCEWKHLPVSEVITVKRKYIEVIVRAKVDVVTTPDMTQDAHIAEQNRMTRFTTPLQSFSVLEDRNSRGAAWLTELMRRNF